MYITEKIDHYLDEAKGQEIELTMLSKGVKRLDKQWSKGNIYYKGMSIKSFYIRMLDTIEKRLKSEDEQISDLQEVYLGYSPKNDMFVSGWDVWVGNPYGTGTDVFSAEVNFDIPMNMGGSGPASIDFVNVFPNSAADLWYSKKGGLKATKKANKDLVDLRLD